MSNYNFNEELCKRLTNGQIAVHYNNGDLEILRALLKKSFIEDTSVSRGTYKYYYGINKYWCPADDTDKPTVPLSDFIVKDNKHFEWTDELALEFSVSPYSTISPLRCGLEQFKASKQRKCLFTTEDGKQIFEEGAEVICVENDFNIRKAYLSIFATPIQCNKYFSNEPAAREYVRLNKPMYSLKQIGDVLNSIISTGQDIKQLITELEKLKP